MHFEPALPIISIFRPAVIAVGRCYASASAKQREIIIIPSSSPTGRIQQPPYLLACRPRYRLPSGPLQDEEMQSPGGWKYLYRNAFCSLAHDASSLCALTPRAAPLAGWKGVLSRPYRKGYGSRPSQAARTGRAAWHIRSRHPGTTCVPGSAEPPSW